MINAQSIDTLPNVNLVDTRFSFTPTNKPWVVDSGVSSYLNSTLAETLGEELGVSFNGFNSLSTASYRGMTAQHTLVLWNGYPVNPPSSGVIDMNLLSASSSDQTYLITGGKSSLYGSQAMGGTIYLLSPFNEIKKQNTSVHFTARSYHSYEYDVQSSIPVGEDIQVLTHLSYLTAVNDFEYVNDQKIERPIEKSTHSALDRFVWKQGLQWNLNHNQKVHAQLWWQHVDRQIAPTLISADNDATQLDQMFNGFVDWYINTDIGSLKLGYFHQYTHLTYNNPPLESFTDTRTHLLQLDYTYSASHHRFGSISQWKADQGYGGSEPRQGGALSNNSLSTLSHQLLYEYHNEELDASAQARYEYHSEVGAIFTYNASLSYDFVPTLSTGINHGRNFRTPTLNERYWSPGGNPNLEPETAFETEWYLRYDALHHHGLQIETQLSMYQNHVFGLVYWRNSNNLWSPQNVEQTQHTGLEYTLQAQWKAGQDHLIHLRHRYDFVLATVAQSDDENSIGSELLYRPRHQWSGRLGWLYKSAGIYYTHTYRGASFVDFENTRTVEEYYVGNVEVNYSTVVILGRVRSSFEIKNIWNANYRTFPFVPLPLRSYHFSVGLVF